MAYFALQTRRDISANRKIGGAFCVLFSFDLGLTVGLKKTLESAHFKML